MQVVVATYNTAGAVRRTNRIYGRLFPARSAELFRIAETNLPQIARVLRDCGAGIVALQETDTCFCGPRVVRQWQAIANELSMSCEFSPSFRIDALGAVRVCTGVATLSSHSISAARRIDFAPRFVRTAARIKGMIVGRKAALHTTIDAGGTTLHVVNAHLTHDSTRQRQHELRTLLNECKSLDPVVLLGDLNFTPPRDWPPDVVHPQPVYDDCMSILREFSASHPGLVHCDARLSSFSPTLEQLAPISTSPAHRPRYKFDYVFLLTRNPRIRLGPETVLDTEVSDHRPVVATLTLG